MPVTLSGSRSQRKARHVVNVHQNQFPLGYISTIDNSRRDQKSLSDLTNIEVVQDNVLRPRPPLVPYGTQAANTIIGRGDIRHAGTRSILWMQNVSGIGKLYKQTDGGAMSLIGGTYSVTPTWSTNVQSQGNAYVFNGVDNLSYVKLADNSIHTYSALATPAIASLTPSSSLTSGTRAYSHFYRVSANNDVGESIASVVMSTTANKVRDSWSIGTDSIVVSWGAVAGATSYTVYYGTDSLTCNELFSVTTTTYTDDGSLAINPYKLAPEGNSTQGAIFTWMYVDTKNSQIFGITSDNKLYYSSAGTNDFSPYNGGGYVGIDPDGDGQLNYVTGFRNGKGDPVITISSRGAAGGGTLYHVEFASLTVGDQTIIYPNVYQANGQAATYAPRATVNIQDSLVYPTGTDFKSTGTSQNILNILTTNSISQVIQPDCDKLSLQYLQNAVGIGYKDIAYFALPVSSTTNNEIWYIDFSRKNLWVLRWTVSATDLWLSEDNSGAVHFCALVNNVILEFTRAGAQTHQDNGVPFRARAAFESLVWDEDGLILGSIRNQYFKFLFPKGNIAVNAYGLTRKGVQTAAGSDIFTTTVTFTGWDADMNLWDAQMWDADPGNIETFGKSIAILKTRPKGLLAQLDWEVVSSTAGTDWILSAVNTKGFALDDLVLKT